MGSEIKWKCGGKRAKYLRHDTALFEQVVDHLPAQWLALMMMMIKKKKWRNRESK
jgi:hypothetical protein